MILINAFLADVKTASKNKVPLVRSSTLSWVTFCIETSNKAVVLKVHKEYVPIFMEVSESHALSSYIVNSVMFSIFVFLFSVLSFFFCFLLNLFRKLLYFFDHCHLAS